MKKMQDLTQHPCWRAQHGKVSHRSGGFGGTCSRCGTEISNTGENETLGTLKWEPVAEPLPFQPGSLQREFYTALLVMGAPLHNGWKERIAGELAQHAQSESA